MPKSKRIRRLISFFLSVSFFFHPLTNNSNGISISLFSYRKLEDPVTFSAVAVLPVNPPCQQEPRET